MLIFGKKAKLGEICSQVVAQVEDGVVVVDRNMEIVLFNTGATRIFGYMPEEALGQRLDILLPERFQAPHEMLVQGFAASDSAVRNMGDRVRQVSGRRKNGEEFTASIQIIKVGGADDMHLAAVVRDVSLTRKTEEELLRLASTDPLTGAFNRREFTAIAEREALRSNRYHHPLSILVLDLDHFKRLNDTYGHAAGDKALQRFTMLCSNTLRNVDIFGRWGGEEFVALLPETDIQGAAVIAERLRRLTGENVMTVNDHKITFTVSIGIAQFREGETSIDPALSRADSAVYDAKKAGRNRIAIFRN